MRVDETNVEQRDFDLIGVKLTAQMSIWSKRNRIRQNPIWKFESIASIDLLLAFYPKVAKAVGNKNESKTASEQRRRHQWRMKFNFSDFIRIYIFFCWIELIFIDEYYYFSHHFSFYYSNYSNKVFQP